jgi:mRNA-degrading endonuclease RelE of RelBE toxin-antitoxin system
VRHRATPKFWQHFSELPQEVQSLAKANFAMLKENPRHPSLRFKKVNRMWSVRVGIHYRALAVEDGSDIVWFWIGHHAEYDRIISERR